MLEDIVRVCPMPLVAELPARAMAEAIVAQQPVALHPSRYVSA